MTAPEPRPGQIHVPHGVLIAGHRVATAMGLLVIFLLALDQRYGWLQHRPGGEAFDLNEQPIFMALFALGALLALRWQLVGGGIAAFTGAALIVFARRQLQTFDAILVLTGFLIPAVVWVVVGLFDLRDEQFHRSPDERPRSLLRRRDFVGGAVVMGLTLIGGVRTGQWIFDRIYGPTHPESTTAAVVASSTRWVWSGAVTSSSAAVTTRLVDDDLADTTPVQLLVSRSGTLRDAREVRARALDEGLVRADIDGLEPATDYHYAFMINGNVDRARIGRFRTHPDGAGSLGIVVGGCARTGSNGAVFDTMRSLDPDLVVFYGDLHYADITRDDQQAFRQVLDHTLTRPAQEALFQRYPRRLRVGRPRLRGVDGSSPSRPAAMATYRQFVPHHPLASSTSAIHQAFTVGRVRIVMTDARSHRDPDDDQAATMLGAGQKSWLLQELGDARDTHALTIWVNPVPWIAPAAEEGDADDWGGFASERTEIARFIADHDVASSLLMVCGDAHMLAIDDGANSDYSGSGAGFPVFHTGALDRQGSVKGGPYTHGPVAGGGQFGHIAIDDSGDELAVVLTGRNWRNQVLLRHEFTV